MAGFNIFSATEVQKSNQRTEKTGGGRLPPETSLSRYDCLAIESVSEVSVKGIDGGIDCTDNVNPGSLLSSGQMVRQSSSVLDDLMDDSEISFDPLIKYFSDPVNDDNGPVEDEPDNEVTNTPTTTVETPNKGDAPVAVRGPLKSNRTATRDIRRAEFDELLREKKRTNNILQERIELKKKKYAFMVFYLYI